MSFKRRTREEQLALFAKVKRLQESGFNHSQIRNEMLGVISSPTVYNWMRREEPPQPPTAKRGGQRNSDLGYALRLYPSKVLGRPPRSRPGSSLYDAARAAVPSDVAQLRDALCQALLAGNMEEHSRLTLALKTRLLVHKEAGTITIPVLSLPAALREAAE